MTTPGILIVDDDRTVCKSLELLLRRAGYRVRAVHYPGEAVAATAEFAPSLVLMDMNFTIDTSGRGGMKLLTELLAQFPDLPVIQITGWATVQLAVEGMKAGARDFIAKPWDNQELLNAVRTQLDRGGGAGAGFSSTGGSDPFASIVGNSPSVTAVLDQARRVAATQASVLITGESGTGKELVAEAIHAASGRASGPFVAVNLGGIPTELFESELFGHKAGSFTGAVADRAGRFERAEGGTLFLDEIGDLAPAAQVKLLRVLQERQYERLGESRPRPTDVRILSATSRQLSSQVAAGTFREDLLYRINLIHLHLPALRDRPEDIPLLAGHFLKSARKRHDRPGLELDRTAIRWLRNQSFPGNIRELQNLIERSVILATGDALGEGELRDFSQQRGGATVGPGTSGRTLEEVEISMIRAALGRNAGEITATARELGLTRAALYRRLEKYNIT